MDTVVLVLTDVQGSTALWQNESAAMNSAMARHHEIVHGAVEQHGGWRPIDQGEGDAVFAAFRSATEAVAAVARVQRGLAAEPWETSVPLRVRIGVHVGEVIERGGNLYGDPVNRCARLRGLGTGGQTLLSAPVYELVRDRLPAGLSWTDLGEHRMKDLVRPEHVWQLDVDGLTTEFPPLASLDRVRHNLPVQGTPLIGRDEDVRAVVHAFEGSSLVTLTGFGGMGKTRLALQVAAELVDSQPDGAWFVDLAGTSDASKVPAAVGRVLGTGGATPDEVIQGLEGMELLVVLDNLEQVLACAPFVAALVAQVPGVRVLATSREPLRVRAELEYPVVPLGLPEPQARHDAASLSTYAAVQLFVDRAVAIDPSFSVTNASAPAVAAICHRLDGHPLALELAAARTRLLSPDRLLERLSQALPVLTGGSRDMPDRHQTLRATIAWSYDLLEEPERLLLGRMSVFAGPSTMSHLEGVCGGDVDVLDALEGLVTKSLVRVDDADAQHEDVERRYGLLVSIREFAAAKLEDRAGTAAAQDHHARWFERVYADLPSPSYQEDAALLAAAHRDVAELERAWAWVLSSGDRERIAAFPKVYLWVLESLDEMLLSHSVAVAMADHGRDDDLWAFMALTHASLIDYQMGLPDADRRRAEVERVQQVLGRGDADLVAHFARDLTLWRAHAEEEVERTLELLARCPPVSPWPREVLARLVDNHIYTLLMYHDPTRAAASARRAADNPTAGRLDVANYGRALYDLGQHDEALRVLAPLVDLGVVQADSQMVHYGATMAATAMMALGRTSDAKAVLDPWLAESTRRGREHEIARQMAPRVWMLVLEGDLEAARDLVISAAASPQAWDYPLEVLRHRLDRLLGLDVGAEAVAASVARHRPELGQTSRQQFTCLLVEQALRESDLQARSVLLADVERERKGLYLPYGYASDLDGLR